MCFNHSININLENIVSYLYVSSEIQEWKHNLLQYRKKHYSLI